MALTRVQATPQGQVTLTATLTLTFPMPPTVGNAVVVLLSCFGTGTVPATGQVTDNRGNRYELVQDRANGTQHAAIFACYAIAATGTPFTLTIALNGTTVSITASAIEVGGITGGGLTVDRTISNATTSTTPTTGATAALQTTADAVVVGVLQTQSGVTQASITVDVVSPTWTQGHELLSGLNAAYGEGDSRVLTGSLTGTTQSITWTIASNAAYAASLVVFASADVLPPLVTSVTQVVVEVLTSLTLLEPPPTGGTMSIAWQNLRGQTDSAGTLLVTPVTVGAITGPRVALKNARLRTDATGALVVASVTAGALNSPREALPNLRVQTDVTGALLVTPVSAGGTLGPLTARRNLRGQVDANGALLVAAGTPGAGTGPFLNFPNLRGRTNTGLSRSDATGAIAVKGLATSEAYQTRIVADGAAAYWPLDDPAGSATARDLVATRHATPLGGVIFDHAGPGAGRAIAFDGTGQLQPPTWPLQGISFTLEAWVFPTATPTVRQGLLCRTLTSNGDFEWDVRPGQIRFTYLQTGTQVTNFAITLAANQWTHLVLVCTGTQILLYVNGIAGAMQPLISSRTGAGQPALGGYPTSTAEGWRGRLSDVAMYQKVLAASDITAHFTLRTAP